MRYFRLSRTNSCTEYSILQESNQGTIWTYQVDWYPTNYTRDNVVIVRSKPNIATDRGQLTITTWTNMETQVVNNITADNLLAIYVKVDYLTSLT